MQPIVKDVYHPSYGKEAWERMLRFYRQHLE